MKVRKVGLLDAQNDLLVAADAPTLACLVTSYRDYGAETVNIGLPLVVGEGPGAKHIKLDIPIFRSILEAQQEAPTNLDPDRVFQEEKDRYVAAFMFKNQAFLVSDEFPSDTFQQEAILLIRKHVFEEENKLVRLKLEVEAIERASSQIGVYKRTSIPEVVKLVVWERDEGKCVRCNSAHNLQFDHIIPVDKGGSNSEENIQLLCADCNLGKSDKIAF